MFSSLIKQRFKLKRTASSGFTLIELLVGAAAASIFLAGTGYIVINAVRAERRTSGISAVQSELAQALDFIQRDLSEAIYIYSDLIQPDPNPANPPIFVDTNGDGIFDGDGIPDLNQLIWDRGFLPAPTNTNTIPVLGFWKARPVPPDCAPGGVLRPFMEQTASTRNYYELIVYTHRRNLASDIYLGNSRIIRARIRPFSGANCDNPAFPFRHPSISDQLVFPDIIQGPAGFLTWPDPLPAAGAIPGGNNNVLTDQIRFGDQIGPVAPRDVLPAPNCPAGYSFGGGDPQENPPVPDAGFYTCVRQPQGNQPQDVQIFITANSMERADPTLFGQYDDRTFSSLAPGEVGRISRYIHTAQTQVFVRGVVDRPED
jgi:prepilin-type N-terminal cleavage/methylation domain-containing protein